MTPDMKVDEKGNKIGRLGVMFTAEPDFVYTREGPIGAIAKGFSDTWRLTKITIMGLAGLFTGAVSTDSLGGADRRNGGRSDEFRRAFLSALFGAHFR